MDDRSRTQLAAAFVAEGPAATEAAGRALGERLHGGQVVALHGSLGAGKTVLARGIARGLGVTEEVTSPTFTIVTEYQGRAWRLCHIDLYRLDTAEAALAFGIEDYLGDARTVCVIEWAERLGDVLPADAIHVYLEHVGPDQRRLCVCEPG